MAHALARTRCLAPVVLILSCWRSCQALLNTSIPNYSDVYKPIDYAVVGQQKSGTSTLWNVLTSNPAVKWVGHGKELFHFSGERPSTTLCDNLVEVLQEQVAVQRLKLNRTDLLVGDWSATHFSCSCCPPALKTLNPNLKVVVVLRDPIHRALSRFLEQKRNNKMPFHGQVANLTFAEFVETEAAALEACVARAAPLRRPSVKGERGRGAAAEEPLAGWGTGRMDMGRWMEMQCYSRSNIIGWSIYDVFLENYLAHFPADQVLVLYTDDLSNRPLESYRRVEAFLGVPPHPYDPAIVGLVFNSRACYHWRCAKKKGELAADKESAAAEGADDGQQQPQSSQIQGARGGGAGSGAYAQATSRLVDLYRPHMQRLFDWADRGFIAPPPESWQKTYG